jgi:lysophospholipid acyltransferase (LPLAT)-like uncharacterized protein
MTTRDLQFRAVGILGKVLLGLYFPFVRCVREGEENFLPFRRRGEPVIFVFWHGQLLPLIHYHRNEGVVVLVSDHADGEYVTRVILRHGFDVARGSSTRGGVKGLKGIVRSIQAGNDLAFTPDGPKGPRHHFKWGAILAAQLSGAPIIPVCVGVDRAWYLKSWDRFMIPKPLSSLRIRYAEARRVPRGASEEEVGRIALDLQETLKKVTLELNPAEAQIRKELHGET